jgi:hypothetical protein
MNRLAAYTTILISGMTLPLLQAEEPCSNADLRGVYSFVASGTFAGAPFATAGQTTYDGKGGASGWIQFSVNGTILPSAGPSTWTAVYNVDPSTCLATKTITLPNNNKLGPLAGAQLQFFISAGGGFRELRFISTSPGATISGNAVKQ